MITYWLYYGNRCITAVRGAVGLTDSQVKALLTDVQSYLCCNRPYETPFEFMTKVRYAEVRVNE